MPEQQKSAEEQRIKEVKERAQAAYAKRQELVAGKLELPRWMWEELEARAHFLALSEDQLIRVWLDERLKE